MTNIYAPRSGAFRKVKYGIPILREEEIPEDDVKNVFEIAKKIKADAEKISKWGEDNEKERRRNSKTGKGDGDQALRKETKNLQRFRTDGISGLSALLMQQKNADHTENLVVPDDKYDALYPATVMLPKFPVKSCSGIECTETDIKEEVDDVSDYDLDSEDENWLEKHPQLYITPSRLEYIFTQLNRRNTHVREKAIGALRTPYHQDFSELFPYWKEKRRENRNVSTFKPKMNFPKNEAKNFGLDPYLVFLAKPAKISLSPQQQRMDRTSKEDVASCLNRISEIKMQLKDLRAWALSQRENGENQRKQIVTAIAQLNESYSSNTTDLNSESEIDQNNNGTSQFTPYCNAYDLDTSPVHAPSTSCSFIKHQNFRQRSSETLLTSHSYDSGSVQPLVAKVKSPLRITRLQTSASTKSTFMNRRINKNGRQKVNNVTFENVFYGSLGKKQGPLVNSDIGSCSDDISTRKCWLPDTVTFTKRKRKVSTPGYCYATKLQRIAVPS